MAHLQNVVLLKTSSVFEDITTFLVAHNDGITGKLQSTAAEYERDIRRFFTIMLNKSIEELVVSDLWFLPKDVIKFQNYMIGAGYKSNTINRNIATLKSLFSYFETNRYKFRDNNNEWVYVSANQFDVAPITKNDSTSWGIFNDNEIKLLIDNAMKHPNGLEKSLAIELASVTSFRIEAILALSWNNFRCEGNIWVVKVEDKKKIHEKPIRTELYDRLLQTRIDENVFHMSVRTLQRTIAQLIAELNFDPERHLTFHSIKKYGIGEVFSITNGNIQATADQGNHASFETAMKYYLSFGKDYARMPCLLIGQPTDLSPLESLSKHELIQLIRRSSKGLQYELLAQLK